MLLDRDGKKRAVENIFENPIKIGELEALESLKMIRVKGQKIYGMFTPHLDPGLVNKLNELLPALFVLETRQRAYKAPKSILNSYAADIVASEMVDTQRILDALNSDDFDLKWIGIETSEENLKKRSVQQEPGYYESSKVLLSLVLTPEETWHTLYLTFDAHIIAAAELPELFREIEFVPLEDHVLIEESYKIYYEEISKIFDYGYIEQYAVNETIKNNIVSIITEAIVKAKKIPQQVMSDELSHLENEKDKVAFYRFFEITNQFVEYMSNRDRSIASNALKQSGNGLILLGFAHAEGVMRHLLSACKDLQ